MNHNTQEVELESELEYYEEEFTELQFNAFREIMVFYHLSKYIKYINEMQNAESLCNSSSCLLQ